MSTVQLTVAGVTRAWVSAENVLGIEEDVGAVGAAPVQAAAKTQKPMTTYRMRSPQRDSVSEARLNNVFARLEVLSCSSTPIGAD